MEVWIDGTRLDVPAGRTLAELLEGVAPHLDPVRLMTRLEEAERARRWNEVATLLADELVPALRATAAAL